jgi:hypothetical protein
MFFYTFPAAMSLSCAPQVPGQLMTATMGGDGEDLGGRRRQNNASSPAFS